LSSAHLTFFPFFWGGGVCCGQEAQIRLTDKDLRLTDKDLWIPGHEDEIIGKDVLLLS